MKSLSSSLAALAVLAVRDGNWEDAARMLSQASVAPDSEQFLEETLSGNYVVSAIVDSVSAGSIPLSDSVAALSAALQIQGEEDEQQALSHSLYGDDEELEFSASSDDDEIDFGDELEDEDDEAISNSSSLINFD